MADALGAATGRPLEVLGRFDEDLAGVVAAWVDEHGWAMVNYDAGVAVLAERPATITKLLLTDASPVSFTDADEVAGRARAAIGAERRTDFDAALAAARAIYPVREDNTIIVGDRPLALLRRWMLEVAGRLVDRGLLHATADAAYLTIDELRRAVEGAGGPGSTTPSAAVAARRRGREPTLDRPTSASRAPSPDISRTPAALAPVNEPILWAVGHEYPPPAERAR